MTLTKHKENFNEEIERIEKNDNFYVKIEQTK